MATSQNGWRAGSRAELGIRTFTVPGTGVRLPLLPGPSATVLLHLAARFDAEVEDIDTRQVKGHEVPDDWGYAERKIRGSETTLSNHASGTAIDLNAVTHPLGVRGTFFPRQVTAIRRILSDFGGVVRWGGDYRSRADEMHFEINAGYDAVAAVAARITGGRLGSRIPKLPEPPEVDDMTPEDRKWLAAELDRMQNDLANWVTGETGAVPENTWRHGIELPDGRVVQAHQILAWSDAREQATRDLITGATVRALTDADLQAIAEAVADEQHRRQES